MKKLLFVLLLAAAGLVACNKDDDNNTGGGGSPEETYANRLNGVWTVSTLTYSATISVPPLPPLPVQGTATNAGTISFDKASRFCNYNIVFLPTVPGVSDSVRLQGAGNWTNTASTVTVVDTATQRTILFTATTNTDAVQIMTTAVNYEIDSTTTVPVTLNFTLVK
jgi:hypothetical protein